MRRTPVLTLTLILVLSALPAGAAPIPGGQANGNPQSDKSADVLSPAVPGPRWTTSLDTSRRAEQSLILDSAGHLLVHAQTTDASADRLTALNTSDGTVDWTTDGVTRLCTPVASDDGRIFVQAQPDGPLVGGDGPPGVFALDAEAGTPIAGAAWVPGDADPPIDVCGHGLILSPDEVLIVSYKTGTINDPLVIQAFDVSGATIDRLWQIERESRGPEHSFYIPVLSADGSGMWVGQRDADENLMIEQIAVADASSRGIITVTGQEFGTGGDGSNNPFTAVAVEPDGIIVETDATDGTDTLVRVDRGAGASLDQTWSVNLTDHESLAGGAASLAVRNNVLYGLFGARQISALDATSGAVVYTREFDADIRGGDHIVVDAIGNVILTSAGDDAMASVTPDGQIRWLTGPSEEFFGTVMTGGPFTNGPIGPDGTLYVAGTAGAGPPNAVVSAVRNGTFRLNEEGDVIDGAIQLCQYLFADNEARSVVLSRDDQFPDVLAGAPLAGDHSCILYTTGGRDQPIDPRTMAEINRVLAPGAPVRIVGGAAAVSEAAEATVVGSGYPVERLGGSSRHETALLIARVVAAENGTGDEVLLAFAHNWPDAVTGGAWAAKTGTPILLTDTDTLNDFAATGLAEFGTTLTTIAGGTAVVSQAAEDAVPGETRRVSGSNRFATAVDVATTLWADSAADQAFVLANLEVEFGWALALAASPLSVRLCAPQVGIANGRYPDESAGYLTSLDLAIPPGVFVLGDLNVIDNGIVSQVETDLGRS